MGTNAVGLSINNMTVLNDMAKMAYGSGFREGKNGGNGFIGAILDSEGNPRIVKMLTHGNERKGIGKTAAEMSWFLQKTDNSILQFYSDNAKNLLTRLAERAGVIDQFNAMLNGEGGKPLLSRKFVARAVEMIATQGKKAEGNTEKFDWNAIGEHRAKTEEVTSGQAIHDSAANLHAAIGKAVNDDREMFTVTDQTIFDDPFETKTPQKGRLMLFNAGKLDRDWKSALLDTLSFASNLFSSVQYHGKEPFDAISIKTTIENFNNVNGGWDSDSTNKLFFDMLKKELKNEIGDPDKPWPSTACKKLQVVKRAVLKAAVCQYAYNAASTLIKDKCRNLNIDTAPIYNKLYNKFMGVKDVSKDINEIDQFEELITYKGLKQNLQSTTMVKLLFEKDMCAMNEQDQQKLKNDPSVDPRKEPANTKPGESSNGTIWSDYQSYFGDDDTRDGIIDVLNKLFSFNTAFLTTEVDNDKNLIFDPNPFNNEYSQTISSYKFETAASIFNNN